MAVKITGKDMFLTDFKRFGILRFIANYQCENCGAKQKELAMQVASVFGGEAGRKVSVQSWKKVAKPARDRMIVQEAIANANTHKVRVGLAHKYNLSLECIKQIVRNGIDKKWGFKDLTPQTIRALLTGKSKARKDG